ncbi:MAG: hypothetical protein R2874_12295 [Desulfobacterales bacterium]
MNFGNDFYSKILGLAFFFVAAWFLGMYEGLERSTVKDFWIVLMLFFPAMIFFGANHREVWDKQAFFIYNLYSCRDFFDK